MKRLLLLRHASSGPAAPGVDDHERSLDARGEREAASVGALLAAAKLQPALLVSSSARRALQTLERIRSQLPQPARVRVERELYLAGAQRLAACVAASEARVDTLLLIAHNPGVAELAVALSGSGDPRALRRMRAKFPPAALASLRFDVERWDRIGAGAGHLVAFTIPEAAGPARGAGGK